MGELTRVGPFDRVVRVGEGARTRTFAAVRGGGPPLAVRQLRPEVDVAQVRRAFAGGATAVHGHPTPALEEGPGGPYYVAPLIPGDPLAHRLRAPLPPKLATRLVIEIARALNQRVHGDLNPRHVLVTADGGVHLIDADPAAPGHRAYRAPERFRGWPASVTAEVYSLGAIWHALITGAPPWSPDDVPRRAPLPQPAQWLARQLLQPEPRDRVRDPDAAGAALTDLLPRLPGPDPSIRAGLGGASGPSAERWNRVWQSLATASDPVPASDPIWNPGRAPLAWTGSGAGSSPGAAVPEGALRTAGAPIPRAPSAAPAASTASPHAGDAGPAPAADGLFRLTVPEPPPAPPRRRWPAVLASVAAGALGVLATALWLGLEL